MGLQTVMDPKNILDIDCLIVDDEPPAVDELNYILSGIQGVTVVDTAFSADRAVNIIRSQRLHLVFLDIKMPGRDGFEVINACADLNPSPFFVFATAYDEHAVKAFDSSAVDYILKPFKPERVKESVERVRQLVISRRQGALYGKIEKLLDRQHSTPTAISKISVERKGRILLLDPKSIVFCKAENKDVSVCTNTKCYTLYGLTSLDELEGRLNTQGFFRTHRSYLVNLTCVNEVSSWFNGKYILTTNDLSSTEVPVSRRRVKALKNRLGL